MHSLNLWGAMTEGMGVLPEVDGLLGQLGEAGFGNARGKKLVPFTTYHAFNAMREAS